MSTEHVRPFTSSGSNRVRTAARGRGWRKDFNLPELTLYIGSFRVQLRSVPRPTYTASTVTADFSSPWPSAHVQRASPSHASQTVFLIKAWNLGLINVACQVTPLLLSTPHSLLSPFSMSSFISNFVNNVCFVRQNYYTAAVHKLESDGLFWNLLLSE